MKLSLLYTNKENIFPTLTFHNGLNVVFAKVKEPKLKDKDSHNLGKTFLSHVIDYCLLAQIDKEHPFKDREDLFGDFIFYLEVRANNGKYVTIQRKVTGRNSISISVLDVSGKLDNKDENEWEYNKRGLDNAREILDGLLDLDVIKPYGFRKGLTYFLRRQSDYGDAFRISKFNRGKDREWKPYVAKVFGFDYELIWRKYETDEKIADKEREKEVIQQKAQSKSEQYDEIKGVIEIKEEAAQKKRSDLDRFDFHEIESDISEDAIKRIGVRIAHLNQTKYKIDYEIEEIERSLTTNYIIDVNEMIQVFREANIMMPESMVRDYQELEDFNRRISSERIKSLQELREAKIDQKTKIEEELRGLNIEETRALALLAEREAIEKYKVLQRGLLREEEEILQLKQKLIQLDDVAAINRQIDELKSKLLTTISEIDDTVNRSNNPVYRLIRKTFVEYVEYVLGITAQIITLINSAGNLDFKITVIGGATDQETHEGEGTSYQKLLAACFDLAILSVYSNSSFYRFVYHDGIFEALDDRKKVRLLELIRRICAEKEIQHILSVIDSDLPRDERDEKLLFTQDEIIRQLHDGGKDGRLFRMEKF
ncbi:MAG: DUF2326 domain-containing protein [Anaerolineae bacterium]|nr:DUF2326 domain-containing protein [Anaerolineae bacterium]